MPFEVHDGENQIAMQSFDHWDAACESARRLLKLNNGTALVMQSTGMAIISAWEVSRDGIRPLTK
jgi:hypothetical protein